MSEALRSRQKFAIRIIRLVKCLAEKDKTADVIGKQILRSGTAIGAITEVPYAEGATKIFLSRILPKKNRMKLCISLNY